MYAGPSAQRKIFLRYENNHYDVIKTVSVFLGGRGYCDCCLNPYMKFRFHECEYKCKLCESYHPYITSSDETIQYCDKCNRTFVNQTCFDIHATIAKRKLICDHVQVCGQCGVKLDWRNRRIGMFVVNIVVNGVQSM